MPRLTVAFDGAASETIHCLQEETTAENNAEVIQNAMTVFDYSVKQLLDDPGLDLTLVGENGVRRIIFVAGVNDTRWLRFKRRMRVYALQLNIWIDAHWR